LIRPYWRGIRTVARPALRPNSKALPRRLQFSKSSP
jgi:hypothetical protein